jgi:hypothetical protein
LGTGNLVIAAAFAAQAIGYPPFDVSGIHVSKPTEICEIDLTALGGELRRLSWSPDGQSIHVQTVESRITPHDYIVSIDDREMSLAFGEPQWAMTYWARKSDLSAPGVPSLKMEIAETNRRTRPAPFSGGFANGGAQTPDVKNPVDAYEAEVTLRLLGVEIGNWINGAPMAGETFGWGPIGSAALVFVDRPGRLIFMDKDKRRHVVGGVKGAWMPAWSPNGTRVAFLQKAARKKYRLMSASVRGVRL